MPVPEVNELLIDEENDEKFAAHGIWARQVAQVLDNDYVILPNRKERRAAFLIIGHDNGGTCIAIPIEPTHEPGVWRPVTAWMCKPSERAKLNQMPG